MNTSLPVPNDGSWPIAPLCRGGTEQLGRGQRNYSASTILDFAALMRIVHHWRWLVLGAVALGLAGAILATLLTRPVYRAWVTLGGNPPTFQVTDEDKDQQRVAGGDTFDFVATQVGLLQSRSVAERAAQELNLANNRRPRSSGYRRIEATSAATSHGGGEPDGGSAPAGRADQVQLRFDLASAGGIGRQRRRRQLHQYRDPAAL